MTRTRKVLALLAAFALLAVACGSDEPEAPEVTEAPPVVTVVDNSAAEAAEVALAEAQAELEAAQAALAEAEAAAEEGDQEAQMALDEATALPGDGVSVTAARADWSTGYMQAAIYAALLEELGYSVSDPADLELAPSNAYVAMANGEFDFWANSWLPNHNSFLAGTMPDGSLVSDHVTRLGAQMARAVVQGLITNKTFADANGLTTLDAMLSDPALFAVYEAADPSPGDGVLQIYGCPEGWGCHVNINAWIANAGWDNIEQFDIGGYDAMIADAVAKDASGEPYIAFTWAPSHYVSDLRPGDNSVWVSIHDDASISPTQLEGATSIGDRCTTDPCLLGWDAADIAVTANNDFLAANPAAARLFELVTINPIDVALQNVRMQGGENSGDDIKRHAAEWITNNRAQVDEWLAVALVPVDDTPGATTPTPTPVAPSTTMTMPSSTTTIPSTQLPDPVSASEFDDASSSERDEMFEGGRILRCREGLALPRDGFCVDVQAASLSDLSYLVAHLSDGDGLILQGGGRFQSGGATRLGWITYEKVGTDRVITHLDE